MNDISRSRARRPGPGTSTATYTAIARQLLRDIEAKLLGPLELLMTGDAPGQHIAELRRQLRADTEMWAAQVTGADSRLAKETISRIISAVYLDGTEFTQPASWWQTPFGSLVARRFGHPTSPVVSLSVASAMLGITRQGAHDLVKRGKLRRHLDEAGVLVSSIQDRLESY
ncbi:hypothetical protein [Amycolatopsis sp.]|uniref:hypothetical protein n=1 Tax=Amycolatopsis sp. TaxID=37632 RepID=UPI002D7ECEEE|nr:hypothetical protein [Amycolatopsis sp.]HET6709500.1 hypothetical protein [Amycolatopsis sp.]